MKYLSTVQIIAVVLLVAAVAVGVIAFDRCGAKFYDWGMDAMLMVRCER